MATKQGLNGGRLIVSLLLPFVAGAIGSVFTFSEITSWYANLIKPVWNPPNWLFGPVWTILYLMIGVSIYLFWQAAAKKDVKVGLEIAGLQLVLNALWSLVFFGLHRPAAALLVIVLLWIAIVSNIQTFRSSSVRAAWWLVPYLVWVTFAGVLNYTVFSLN